MKFNTQFAYERPEGFSCGDELVAVQSAKEECDINTIVRKFGVTKELPVGARALSYGDFNGVDDFQTAMNAVVSAQRAFEALPSGLRARFFNDPQVYMEYCTQVDSEGKLVNLEEMRKLKIAIEPEVVVESPPTRVVVVKEE